MEDVPDDLPGAAKRRRRLEQIVQQSKLPDGAQTKNELIFERTEGIILRLIDRDLPGAASREQNLKYWVQRKIIHKGFFNGKCTVDSALVFFEVVAKRLGWVPEDIPVVISVSGCDAWDISILCMLAHHLPGQPNTKSISHVFGDYLSRVPVEVLESLAEIQPTDKMTKEQRVVAWDLYRNVLHANLQRAFPKGQKAFCYRHGTMCPVDDVCCTRVEDGRNFTKVSQLPVPPLLRLLRDPHASSSSASEPHLQRSLKPPILPLALDSSSEQDDHAQPLTTVTEPAHHGQSLEDGQSEAGDEEVNVSADSADKAKEDVNDGGLEVLLENVIEESEEQQQPSAPPQLIHDSDSESEKPPRPRHLWSAGTSCVNYANYGAHDAEAGDTTAVYIPYNAEVVAKRPECAVYEITKGGTEGMVNREIGQERFGVFEKCVNPLYLGDPASRDRRYSWAWDDDVERFQGSHEEFEYLFHRKPVLTADVYLFGDAASEDERRQIAKDRAMRNAKLEDVDVEHIPVVCQLATKSSAHYAKYMSMKEERQSPCGAFVFDVEQQPSYATSGWAMPALVTHGALVNAHHDCLYLPIEHLVVQGEHVRSPPDCRFPSCIAELIEELNKTKAGRVAIKVLAGNSMHAAALESFLFYCMSRTSPRYMRADAIWQIGGGGEGGGPLSSIREFLHGAMRCWRPQCESTPPSTN